MSPGERRLHPLTPLAKAWTAMVALAFLAVDNVGHPTSVTTSAVVVIAVIAAALGMGAAGWWVTWYRLDATELVVRSGVLVRRTRHLRLDRLQAVDVVRPVMARVFGLAELRIEVAGGRSSKASLAYLSEPTARRLRAELLARAAGIGPATPEAPEQVLLTVPPLLLARSILADLRLLSAGLVSIGLVVVVVRLPQPGLAVAVLPAVLAAGSVVFREFARHFDFTVAQSPDGLRLRHGLLEHRAQTVPPGRVQAVRMVQPALWRWAGWARLEINVAGYVGSEKSRAQTVVLLPVGSRELARALAGLVLPGPGPFGLPMEPAPRRAAWRQPWGWWVLGVAVGAEVAVVRRGWWRRRTDLIAHGKTQSLRLTQGPWQRALGLASIHLDSTPGPVHVVAAHRDALAARRWVEEEARRSRDARTRSAPEKWMLPPQAGPKGSPPVG